MAFAPREGRLERFAGALGGATVGLSLALALVGASVLGWGPAVAVAVPVMTAVGALASASGIGRAIGGAALAAVPLMAVAGARVEWIAGLVALGSAEVGRAIAALDPFLDMRSLRPGDRVAAMREPDTRTLRRVEFRRAATQVWAAVRDDAGQWRGERVEVVMRTETVRTGFRVEWIAGLVALGSAAVVAAMGLGRTPLSGRA